MSTPIYAALPIDSLKQQIRLLQFGPTKYAENLKNRADSDSTAPAKAKQPGSLHCDMIKVSLDDDPDYRTVSYSWYVDP